MTVSVGLRDHGRWVRLGLDMKARGVLYVFEGLGLLALELLVVLVCSLVPGVLRSRRSFDLEFPVMDAVQWQGLADDGTQARLVGALADLVSLDPEVVVVHAWNHVLAI